MPKFTSKLNYKLLSTSTLYTLYAVRQIIVNLLAQKLFIER